MGNIAGNHVLITGVLGGLGSTVTQRLLKQGVSVLGVDSFFPGAASPLHQKYQLEQLRQHPTFSFLAADYRTLGIDDITVEGLLPRSVLHAAGLSPWSTTPLTADTLSACQGEAAIALIDSLFDASVKRVLVPQWSDQNCEPSSATGWDVLAEVEKHLRSATSEHANLLFPVLPLLWGVGQSPATPPLRPLLQALSGAKVELPDEKTVALFVHLDRVSEVLAELLISDKEYKRDDFLSALQPVSVAVRPWIEVLLERAGLTLEVSDTPLSCPDFRDSITSSSLSSPPESEETDLLEWVVSLPHVPPADWAQVPKREKREQRAKRKRLKKERLRKARGESSTDA